MLIRDDILRSLVALASFHFVRLRSWDVQEKIKADARANGMDVTSEE
jgi:hypothetical protein